MVAIAAHIGCKSAERHARESYQELVGEGYDAPADRWEEIRPLAGRWGCLVPGLELARGLGVAVAGGAALYLLVGS
jgi:hypothetical protein